jgi:signal peptidase I
MGSDSLDNVESKKARFRKDAVIFLLLALFFLIVKSSVYEPFRIPSGSMLPTLKIGDFIIVDKMSYGLKVPFSDFFLNEPIYLTNHKIKIGRGDVIVFKFPKNPQVNYIKRVIGIPGDKIKIVEKKIILNGVELKIKSIDARSFESKDLDPRYKDSNFNYYETKISEKMFNYQLDKDNYFKVDYDEIVIPKHKYFVLGDNRDFSNDSRYWGLVPESYIKGRAEYIWLSVGKSNDAKNSYFFRSERFGLKIK